MKTAKIILLIFMLCVIAAGRAGAEDIDFNFEVPTMPYPPQITDISNSSAVLGGTSFTVVASIQGQMQMKGFCDIVPRDDCTINDWYQIADPDVTPNPPTIQKATVYYYINNNAAGAGAVDMVYDAGLERYKAEVPLAGVSPGDKMTYYIAAIDSRGNVASQIPDTSRRPCTDVTSWDAALATPVTNSCSYATSYLQCGESVTGTPNPCGSGYTMNDKSGDVCGEPNAQGVQSVITGAGADKVDILGISAGADSDYLCMKMGLKAPPPNASDPAPVEGYLALFYNPDIYDPNPGDTHITNSYAITYSPEAVGSDPTLVKVLWSGDCVTNPNTANPLDCKLVSAVGGSSADLQIGYNAGLLYYRVKKFGVGSPLAVNYSIFGNNTKQTSIIGLTAEINLSGGTAFWISDVTPGFAIYHTNRVFNPPVPPIPAAPMVLNTRCSVDGTGGTSSVCARSMSMPAQNKCKINFYKSLDYSFVSEYRIYRNTTNSASGAALIGTVAENWSGPYSYTDTHTTLHGDTYYYFLSSYTAASGNETNTSDWSKTKCTVENWEPVESAVINRAGTPAGNEKKCKIDWSLTTPDPSLESFFVNRSDDGGASYTTRNSYSPVPASPVITSYEWTDGSVLELNRSYYYTVTSVDLGGNTNTSTPAVCVPQDLKSPVRNNSLVSYGVSNKKGVKMEWQAGSESDIAGYNAYYCKMNNRAVDCRTSVSFTKLNSSLIPSTTYQADENTHPSLFSEPGDFCVYLETCDSCNTLGICPGNGGEANCSGFPPGGADSTLYVKCWNLWDPWDTKAPAFPGGVSCEAPPEGGAVSLSWNKICQNADGTPFSACDAPENSELVGYKIIFGDRGAIPDLAAAPPASVAGMVPVGGPPAFTHTGRVNGREYCYNVYGLDSFSNYSQTGPGLPEKIEVCCTPGDTVPPARPVYQSLDFTPVSCSPSWLQVEDMDPLTYNVYRCEGTTAECALPANFTLVSTEVIPLLEDLEVISGNEYQYCATAVDPSGNESVVVGSGANPNCGTCIPSDLPPPVTGMAAAPLSATENTGAKLFWSRNEADDGLGGYNVYRCLTAACENRGAAIRSCLNDPATAAAPLLISGEPAGDWYYGATYMKDCGDTATESHFDISEGGSINGPVSVPPPLPPACIKCVVISSCSDYDAGAGCIPVQKINTAAKDADGKFVVSGVPGYEVFLADSSYSMIGTPAITDSNGNYKLILSNDDNSINLTNKYKVLLRVPAADKSGVPCSPTDIVSSDCYIVLDGAVTLTDDSVTKRVYGVTLPEPGGGRAEIGNPDCNGYVDIDDLGILMSLFGSTMGDGKYQTYADFDGSGFIDLDDFVILKQNIGKTLDAAPAFDAVLCKPQ